MRTAKSLSGLAFLRNRAAYCFAIICTGCRTLQQSARLARRLDECSEMHFRSRADSYVSSCTLEFFRLANVHVEAAVPV